MSCSTGLPSAPRRSSRGAPGTREPVEARLPGLRPGEQVLAVGHRRVARPVVAARSVGRAVRLDQRREPPEADAHVHVGLPAAALAVGLVLELPPRQLARPDALHRAVAAGDPPAAVFEVLLLRHLARAGEDGVRIVPEDVLPAGRLLLQQRAGERQLQPAAPRASAIVVAGKRIPPARSRWTSFSSAIARSLSRRPGRAPRPRRPTRRAGRRSPRPCPGRGRRGRPTRRAPPRRP